MEKMCRTKEIRKIYATVLKIEGITIYFSKAKAVLEGNWRNWNREKGGTKMPYVIQTNHLTKSVGNKEIVKDISLHVKKGEIYGFWVPMGRGKLR